MGKWSIERRARFVMFVGLAMLAALLNFGDYIKEGMGYDMLWVFEDGWLHALASALILLGAWTWMNALEDRRRED